MHNAPAGRPRVDWVDSAKGICILLVVMMHSTLGVEAAMGVEGWMHHLVAFAAPFRIPAFFLIAGLFLAATIDKDWRTYLDRKVVHFAYFYLLWVGIQVTVKMCTGGCPLWLAPYELAKAVVMPFGTLWFIWMLPVFFVVTKLLRNWPPLLVWSLAAMLEIAPVATGYSGVDEFAARYVYFLTGYYAAALAFDFATLTLLRSRIALLALAVFAGVTWLFVTTGAADAPFVSLLLGFVGAAAIVSASALMSRSFVFDWIAFCGRKSIVIYLAFFLPMAVTRIVLVKTGLIADVGTVSLIVWVAAVIGALVMYKVAMALRLTFLFERPGFIHLAPAKAAMRAKAV
jgi:uncharacterized membrane protein YcfT